MLSLDDFRLTPRALSHTIDLRSAGCQRRWLQSVLGNISSEFRMIMSEDRINNDYQMYGITALRDLDSPRISGGTTYGGCRHEAQYCRM